MTFKITLAARRPESPTEPNTVEVEVPALPREGDYVSHEPSSVQGRVQGVAFWWSEDGDPLHIEVRLK